MGRRFFIETDCDTPFYSKDYFIFWYFLILRFRMLVKLLAEEEGRNKPLDCMRSI